jgi:hypothetical protein
VEGSSDAYEEARRLNASLNDEIASLRQLVKSSSLAASPSGEFYLLKMMQSLICIRIILM